MTNKTRKTTSILIMTILIASAVMIFSVMGDADARHEADGVVPDSPINLLTTSGDTDVLLSWDAPVSDGGASITDYVIEFKLTTDTVWTEFEPLVISSVTTTTVTGLTNGLSYDFKVSAVNAVGTSTASTPVSTTPILPNTVPDAPTGFVATSGNSQVVLLWTAPADGGAIITDYLVEYSTDGITWTTFADGVSITTSVTVTGLTNGQAYSFRISSVNVVGSSISSDIVIATPAQATSTASITKYMMNIEEIAVDKYGNLYVAETMEGKIFKFNSTGAKVAEWGNEGSKIIKFDYIKNMVIGADGNIYVYNMSMEWNGPPSTIQKFSPTGTLLAKWNLAGPS